MTDFIVAIPARHAASRLPGKPLRLLGGEPLVLHVARRALEAGAREAWVATDDARIAEALQRPEMQARMKGLDLFYEGQTGAVAAKRLADLNARYGELVRSTGMKAE